MNQNRDYVIGLGAKGVIKPQGFQLLGPDADGEHAGNTTSG
jgi:hypothetical protein